MTAIQQTEFRQPGSEKGESGKIFGFPLKGFGLFSSLLLSFASAIITFCLTTMVAIFSLLVWRMAGHAGVDFAMSYRDVGFPASMGVLALALPFFLTLWVRAKFLK
ncbi:hypothetical protein [Terracidiphilus gabretensis]|jgi:hypothetical protein|uniref:hypothetical protein n=1 Tax=Terracidiphilus gabretensis TaxID=1577687 RepID=UPI00071BDC5D|nr:hypothetical protein [Terracidiphilus gabretensis]